MHVRQTVVGLALIGACGSDSASSEGSGLSTGTSEGATASASAVPTTDGTSAASVTAGPTDGTTAPATTDSEGSSSETSAGPPLPFECGAFTPGDDLTVCTATYLGGPGGDTPGGVDVAPDGAVLVGGEFPGHTFAGRGSDGDGVVLRMTADGRGVTSAQRFTSAVRSLEVAWPGGQVAVATADSVVLLPAELGAPLWTAALAGSSRVSVGSDGTVAALHGKQIAVFDPLGAPLADFAVAGTQVADLAVHAESQSVLATGYRQSDEGACQQYKSTFIRSYAYNGTLKWTDYDWDGTEVDDTEDCADSEGKGLAIGRDGQLYYAAKSDGGNTVHRKQPRDLQLEVDNVSFDPYNTGYGFKGANALGYYARIDPSTGDHLGGQFVLARKATGDEDPAAAEANAAVPEQATALADGTMVIVGSSAYLLAGHDKQSVGGVKVGGYTAYEPFVLIVASDFSQRLAWTAFTASGPGFARAVGVGSQSAALLFGQSTDDSAKGPLITVDALQPAPGGDAEVYLAVLPTP
jgi:hypothetical protein